ncbi:MAG: LptF/LptG family permease [Pantoea sp. Brub]|nr:LptF/LptG family permease [Pantoea sp. Brub]
MYFLCFNSNFFFQKTIRILNSAVDGHIPVNLIFTILALGLPEILQFILPLSLFLAILFTFNDLHKQNEILGMQSCGISIYSFIITVIILTVLTAIFATINIIWFKPWSVSYENRLFNNISFNSNISNLSAKKFQIFNYNNIVLYIEKIKGNKLHNIFITNLYKKNNNNPWLIISNTGKINICNNNYQLITLNKALFLEGTPILHQFDANFLINYQIFINLKHKIINLKETEQSNFLNLLHNKSFKFRAELHWRLTLIMSVLVMSLIALSFSIIGSRRVSFLSMIFYLAFFLIQSIIKSNGETGYLNPAIWMWLINISYLLISIILLYLSNNPVIYQIKNYFHNIQ